MQVTDSPQIYNTLLELYLKPEGKEMRVSEVRQHVDASWRVWHAFANRTS